MQLEMNNTIGQKSASTNGGLWAPSSGRDQGSALDYPWEKGRRM